MARLSDEQYERLKDAFLQTPDNYANAGQVVGVQAATAKHAYLKGYPKRGLLPIKAVIDEIRIRVRAELEADRSAERAVRTKEREEARNNAVRTVKEEGQVVTLSRSAALQHLAVSVEIGAAARAWVPIMKNRGALERARVEAWTLYETAELQGVQPLPAKPAGLRPMSLENIVQVLNRGADFAGKIDDCAQKAMEMQRLYLGEPTQIIGIVDETREMTLDELEIRREAANRAIEDEMRATDGFRVIQGGLSEEPEDPEVGRRVVPPPVVGKG